MVEQIYAIILRYVDLNFIPVFQPIYTTNLGSNFLELLFELYGKALYQRHHLN